MAEGWRDDVMQLGRDMFNEFIAQYGVGEFRRALRQQAARQDGQQRHEERGDVAGALLLIKDDELLLKAGERYVNLPQPEKDKMKVLSKEEVKDALLRSPEARQMVIKVIPDSAPVRGIKWLKKTFDIKEDDDDPRWLQRKADARAWTNRHRKWTGQAHGAPQPHICGWVCWITKLIGIHQ